MCPSLVCQRLPPTRLSKCTKLERTSPCLKPKPLPYSLLSTWRVSILDGLSTWELSHPQIWVLIQLIPSGTLDVSEGPQGVGGLIYTQVANHTSTPSPLTPEHVPLDLHLKIAYLFIICPPCPNKSSLETVSHGHLGPLYSPRAGRGLGLSMHFNKLVFNE